MNHNAEISPPLSKTIEANEYLKDEHDSEDIQSMSPEERAAITKRMLLKLDFA